MEFVEAYRADDDSIEIEYIDGLESLADIEAFLEDLKTALCEETLEGYDEQKTE